MKSLKALMPVQVTHKRSALYAKKGRIVNVNSSMAVVEFDDIGAVTMFNWQIEPTTRYTDKSKPTEASKDPNEVIKSLKNALNARISDLSKEVTHHASVTKNELEWVLGLV